MTAYEQSMAELVRRVEALEDRRNEHFAEQTARIVAGPPDAAELKRQDRWHETYNAALMSALGSFDGWSVETLHEHSVECADRAHGPLETAKLLKPASRPPAECPHGVPWTNDCGQCLEDDLRQPMKPPADRAAHGPLWAKAAAVIPPIEHASWKMFADPRVEALVKAARDAKAVLEAITGCDSGDQLSTIAVELPKDGRPRQYLVRCVDDVDTNLEAALKPFEDAP